MRLGKGEKGGGGTRPQDQDEGGMGMLFVGKEKKGASFARV